MSIVKVLDGQARRFRRGGSLASSVTATIPEGYFLKRASGTDEYETIDGSGAVVVFLNLVGTDRNDVTSGGPAVIGGESYELETDVYDSVTTFTMDSQVTVKLIGAGVSGILAMATSGDQINGYVLEAPSTANGSVLRVLMHAASVCTVA